MRGELPSLVALTQSIEAVSLLRREDCMILFITCGETFDPIAFLADAGILAKLSHICLNKM